MIDDLVFQGLKDLKSIGKHELELPPQKKDDLYFFKKQNTTYIAELIHLPDNKKWYNFIIAYEVKQ